MVLLKSALEPTAVLLKPVVFDLERFITQERVVVEEVAALLTSRSCWRRKRKASEGERDEKETEPQWRPIDRISYGLSCHIFCFSLFVEVGLLNCIDCNPVPRGTQKPSSRGALNSGLTSADSGLQLDLEIALSGVSAKVQPLRDFQPGRRSLKRRMT